MNRYGMVFGWMLIGILGASPLFADTPATPLALRSVIARAAFQGREPLFSFTCDGKPSAELLKTWVFKQESRQGGDNRIEHTLLYTDPKTGLEVRCQGVIYPASSVLEWTVYFTNRGSQDTPLLESIQAIDCVLDGQPTHEGCWALRHFSGSQFSYNDFEPRYSLFDHIINRRLVLSSTGGKSSNGVSPYFNLESIVQRAGQPAVRGGTILAVGWPGQWQASFSLANGNKMRVIAGQQHTRFKLHPGETARSPLITLLEYEGDWIEGQNAWRRWMFAHNVPKIHGRPIPPVNVPSSSSYFDTMGKATVENQIAFIDGYLKAGIPIDYWWMDAGWYPMASGGWWSTGTWEVDSKRFPKGLRPISDHAHAKNIKTILWFEPERVTKDSWLFDNRPQWLLKTSTKQAQRLLNLGLPAAREWMADTIDRVMTQEGIDLYRQDFNIHPLPFWSANDTSDRIGMTENHYIQGYLWLLDELKRRKPELVIDLCASGGMRHDLESLRRGIVFTQSDYDLTPEGDLNQNYSLPFLMPYHGHSVPRTDAYGFWCCATPGLHPRWDLRKPESLDKGIARRVETWRNVVAPCYWGDYYPLTPYSPSPDTWAAFQYNHPSEKRAILQVFRRSTSCENRRRFRLRGLDRGSHYEVTVVDGAGMGSPLRGMQGSELMDAGIEIVVSTSPGVAILSIATKVTSADEILDPSVKVERVADGFHWTEGTVSDKRGNLYFSDIPASRIYVWSTDNRLSIFRESTGRANGLRFDRAGNLLACEGATRRVTATSPKGIVTVLADQYQGKRLNSPNDLWVAPNGGVYFTDPRYSHAPWVWSEKNDMTSRIEDPEAKEEQEVRGVYYLPPNGDPLRRFAETFLNPNGIFGTADGQWLYVSDTDSRTTYRFRIQKDGSLTDRMVIVPDYSDGLTLDERGNLYLTNHGVKVYMPDGRLITTIHLPPGAGDKTANVGFGGQDRRTLFIAAGKGLYAVRTKVRGQ